MPGWNDRIAAQLRRPTTGFTGWLVKQLLKSRNGYLEVNAVRLCKLEKDHSVLEVGFGPGVGLKKATEVVMSGSGKVYGIDFSAEMMREASKLLETEVTQSKVELVLGDAAFLPYRDSTMDRIFHCNCYYFWPDADQVLRELMRVLKPGGLMVTNLNVESVQQAERRGFLKFAVCPNHDSYMDRLKQVGFTNVEMNNEYCPNTNKEFQTIYAYKQNGADPTQADQK